MEGKLIPVGAQWNRVSNNGKQYESIKIELNLIGFTNDYKTEDKHPDIKLFISAEPREKPATQVNTQVHEKDLPF
jgi:hypothetical protein